MALATYIINTDIGKNFIIVAPATYIRNYKYRDFLKEYTYLIPSGDVRCLTPEGLLSLELVA